MQECLLRAGNQKNQIELKPWNVENYSLLDLGMFDNNNTDYIKESELFINDFLMYFCKVSYQLYYVRFATLIDNNAIKKNVYGIHGELRRVRLCLNNQRPKLVIKEYKLFVDVV